MDDGYRYPASSLGHARFPQKNLLKYFQELIVRQPTKNYWWWIFGWDEFRLGTRREGSSKDMM